MKFLLFRVVDAGESLCATVEPVSSGFGLGSVCLGLVGVEKGVLFPVSAEVGVIFGEDGRMVGLLFCLT